MASDPLEQDDGNVVPFDPADFIRTEQRRASMAAISSFEDNPDNAARAQQLATATGAHPALVYGDLENFEQQHKAALTHDIVSNNEYIQRWINEHPLAAKVSNDDVGQLDVVTQKLRHSGFIGAPSSIVNETIQGALKGWQRDETFGTWALRSPGGMEMWDAGGLQQAGVAIANIAGIPFELLGRGFSATLEGAHAGLKEGYKQFGGTDQGADRFARDMTGMLEYELMGVGAHGVHIAPDVVTNAAREMIDRQQARQLMEYIKVGKEPPAGISRVYDELKIMEAEKDLKNYDEVMKETQASSTKERSPELFAEYVRDHTEAQIGVSAQKIKELYGDKTPAPDDNLLGWIPNLAERLELEAASGGRIEVPLADWVAKVDPDVAKEVHDFVSVRRGGLSKEDIELSKETAKVADKPFPEGPPQQLEVGHGPTDAVRAALHAEPMFDLERQQKLRLLREEADPDLGPQEPGSHFFNIVDGENKPVGHIALTEKDGGKNLYIQWVGAVPKIVSEAGIREKANTFGPRIVRDLLAQLKQEFPDAESIAGVRISGAKVAEGGGGVFTKVPLHAPPPDALERMAFHLNVISSERSLLPPSTDFTPRVAHTSYGEFNAFAIVKARDIIDMVVGQEDQFIGSLPKALYQFFGERLKEFTGDDDIVVISKRELDATKPGVGGWYEPDSHRIFLPTTSLDQTFGRYYAPRTIIHELTHAVTHRALMADKVLHNNFTMLMNEANEYMTNNLPEQRKYFDYAFTNVSEFVAETWARQDLQQTLSHIPISKELADALGMKTEGNTIWHAVRKIVGDILEKILGFRPEPSILDGVLTASERFDDLHAQYPELRKQGYEGIVAQAFGPRPTEIPQAPTGEKPVAERPVIKTPGTFGLTPEQFRRYKKLIDERMQQDHEAELSRAVKEENKRQSKEWKDNEAEMRTQVTQDIYNRPDVAANEWFRTGTLFGQKGRPPRIDPRFLSPEQKAGLPSDYVRRNGINPDDVAGTFGYQSGKAMVDRMVLLNNLQKQSELSGRNFINSLVDKETERRMQEKYGDLGANILQEAKDQVMNETQLDIIHEDILALAEKAKSELPFDRASVKQWVKDEFLKTPMRAVDSDAYIADAGKIGKTAELHLLRGDFGDAFREKQAQYMATLKAQEAIRVEKLKAQFDKNAKRFSARVVSSVAQEYTNWIHDILMRTGGEVKRTPEDLANSISHMPQKTFQEFVQHKESMLRETGVADFLLDMNWKKKLDDLTVDEFKAIHDSIKGLIKNGRDEKKIIKAGEAAELDVVLAGMYDQLKAFGSKKYTAEGKRFGKMPRTFVASHLQIESLVNRWDKGDPFGSFTQYITRDLIDSANQESLMEREFSRKLRAIADNVDLNQKIDNNVFMDPYSVERGEPTPILMTRKNLRAIMQHLGNDSNFTKLAKGYLFDPTMAPGDNAVADFKARIMDWVNRNATKEDWDWASKQGKIFAELKDHSDRMYRRLTDIEPESLPLKPVQTPFGTYDGWYHPLDNHPLWKGSSKSLMGPEPLEEGGYYRATTSNRYTQKRTGASYPLALDLDMTPVRMKQIIHDINFREAIINSAKVIYDKRFINAVSDFYGKEYADLFVPWLRDVAGSANYRSAAQKTALDALEHIRQNVIATLIGFNPGTVMKHGPTAAVNSITEVGPLKFLTEVKGLFSVNEATGESNWKFAMDKSAELQRRTRHYSETMGGAQERVLGELTPIEAVKLGKLPSYMSMRESLIKLGSTPVAISDLLSAVPTWLAQYKTSIREGLTEGDAVYMADRAVRRAHGSTAVTSRPEIARGRGLATYLSSLYGFFSHIWNRQFELGWRMRETAGLVKEGEYTAAAKELPRHMAMMFSYVLFPAIIEELVTPLSNDERESWGKKAAKALTFGLTSSWIGIRDITHAALSLRDPQAGLISTTFKTATDVARDLSKGPQAFDRAHMGATIQHGVTAFGALTGLTNAPEGRAARFIHDYAVGKERPRGWHDWYRGLRFGTTREFR